MNDEAKTEKQLKQQLQFKMIDTDTGSTAQKYKLSDLIDLPLLLKLLDSTNMLYAVVDGDDILGANSWTDICTKFHRMCPITERGCNHSDSYLNRHLKEGIYMGHKCPNGLMDYAAPIIVDGHYLAGIFTGQLFHEPPDEEYFRQQARECGFDEEAYIDALRKVPIVSEEQVQSTMEFYVTLGQVVASLGLEKLRRLEEAEDKFMTAFNSFPDPVTVTELATGRYVDVNDAWIKTVGYEKKEAIGLDALELGVYLDRKDREAILEEINRIGCARNIETYFRMKSGEVRIFLTSLDKIFIGDIPHLLGVHRDITERKQIEKCLQESRNKFSKAFHINPDWLTISTMDGYYVEVNDSFLSDTGYTRSEAIGHSIDDLGIWVVPEERNFMLEQLIFNGEFDDFEVQLRMKSGTVKTYLVSAEIIDINGKPHVLSDCKDITERKSMVQSLKAAEAKFFTAFQNSPSIMAILSLPEYRFIDVNQTLCQVMDYQREEVLGISWRECELSSRVSEIHNDMRELFMTEKVIQNIDIEFFTKSKQKRNGLLSAALVDIAGQECILITIHDITELRQIQAEVAKLDRLNLIGEMAASIGHEIRNPMTTVRGFLQMFESKYQEDQEFMRLMIEELDRANAIITEFLSLAKDKIVELKPKNLNKIIKNIKPLLEANATMQDKQIELDLNPDPVLMLDEKEIRQLVLNLANNGLEAMDDGGTVTIKTYQEDENMVLSIQDQGTGVDPEIIDKLGTPFVTTKDEGTGLGLAVCYRIAARHYADIDIVSDTSGTNVLVRFPITVAC